MAAEVGDAIADQPRWKFNPALHLFVPNKQAAEQGEADDRAPALAYFDTEEALQWDPWPIAMDTCSDRPFPPEVTAMRQSHMRQSHDAALKASGGEAIGYASWLSANAVRPECTPLVLRETTQHTGTRIWQASWLHREWALHTPDLFARHIHVHEMGAGCGLLGLSVAAAFGVHVTVSDFRGHFESEDDASVMGNLAHNAARNHAFIHAAGGDVRVLELDWAQPDTPSLWWEDSPSNPTANATRPPTPPQRRRPVPLQPADVVLATEVLYTDTGTRLFVGALTRALGPTGVRYPT